MPNRSSAASLLPAVSSWLGPGLFPRIRQPVMDGFIKSTGALQSQSAVVKVYWYLHLWPEVEAVGRGGPAGRGPSTTTALSGQTAIGSKVASAGSVPAQCLA
ncbi:unnamed protein product [Pleuronectes platessa]|uniref:Uncharacterized protein n=1 Tax=Pleuronectes platessa TaxID=8262 RepID=A0A9N7Z0V2_PLEPL|nr:unnamed protein product [Pleuronectes platessa]